MAGRNVLNARRLTKSQVAGHIASGAKRRLDLEAAFENAFTGMGRPGVYELPNGHILRVFNDEEPGLGGKGDIYVLDDFMRSIRWAERVDADRKRGITSSVGHWFYHSKLRTQIPHNVETLLDELDAALLGRSGLTLSYAGLDPVSRAVNAIGVERAQAEFYDHLVALVGEIVRIRTRGLWNVAQGNDGEPYPYISAPQHATIMVVNVVWAELTGTDLVDLRRGAANEVRRARANYLPPAMPPHQPLHPAAPPLCLDPNDSERRRE